MSNEIIFIIQTLIGLFFTLIAFKLGKVWIYAFIASCVILANIFVNKQITLLGLNATGGNVVYGAIFLATDLLSEHYGKKEARKGVFIGFFVSLFYLSMTQMILLFKKNSNDWGASEAMDIIFSTSPSIVFASLIAYLISQLNDIWLFHFIKSKTNEKFLWLRNNLSTYSSQLFDSIIFSFLAFYLFPLFFNTEQLPFQVIIQIVITTYLLKLIVAVIDTPFIYLSKKI